MIFLSCEKEFIDKDSENLNAPSYNIFPSQMRSSNAEVEFAKFPQLDLYKDVLIKLYSDSIFQSNYHYLTNEFGHPRINFATIDVTSATEYVLTIPLVKDDKITSFIFYFANGTYGYFNFAPINLGFSLLTQSVNSEIEPVSLLTLVKFHNYQSTRYSRRYTSINNWIVEYVDFQTNLNSSDERTISITYSVEIDRYFDGVGVHIVYDWVTSIFPCGGSGSSGGGGTSSGFPQGEGGTDPPGGGSSGTSPDTPPDEGKDKPNSVDPYDINEDCLNYFITEGALVELRNLAESSIYACNPGITTEDLIQQILDKLCDNIEDLPTLAGWGFEIQDLDLANLTITAADIRNALLEEDYVMTSGIGNDCPKLKCLLDILTGHHPAGEGDGNFMPPLLCNFLNYFLGNDLENDRHLFIQVTSFSDYDNLISNANAFVNVIWDHENLTGEVDPQIRMVFNSDKCESLSTFSLFETFVHELIHADIYRRLIDVYGVLYPFQHDHAFEMLLEHMGYDGTNWNDQHQLMLDHYIIEMATILYEANGQRGDLIHYKHFVLNGFPLDLLVQSDWFDNEGEVFNLIGQSLDILQNEEGFDENFNLCD